MNILIIEDEGEVRSFLIEALKGDQHQTYECASIQDIEKVINGNLFNPDVILMDRLLLHIDSTLMIGKIKTKFPECKILVLSGINSTEEKAKVLDLGADDYVSKPFSLPEVLARIRVLGRRATPINPQLQIKAGDILIDVKSRIVTAAGKRLDLTHKEYLLLSTLLQELGKVYSKTELMSIIWDVNSAVESNVVEVTMMNLRKKIESVNSTLKISSRRNVGYWVDA